jgi:hypothetical protein
MKQELKKVDYVNVFLVELKAFITNKYQIDFFNPFFDHPFPTHKLPDLSNAAPLIRKSL